MPQLRACCQHTASGCQHLQTEGRKPRPFPGGPHPMTEQGEKAWSSQQAPGISEGFLPSWQRTWGPCHSWDRPLPKPSPSSSFYRCWSQGHRPGTRPDLCPSLSMVWFKSVSKHTPIYIYIYIYIYTHIHSVYIYLFVCFLLLFRAKHTCRFYFLTSYFLFIMPVILF